MANSVKEFTYTKSAIVNLPGADTFSVDGYRLTGWNTLSDGTGTPYSLGQTVTANDSMSFYAQWEKIVAKTYALTLAASPAAGGTVSKSPSKTGYAQGESVTVNAVANSGYTFGNWSDGGAQSHAVTMPGGNKSLTAYFNAIPVTTKYTVTIGSTTNGMVTVTCGGAAVASGTKLDSGSIVTITATPSSGYSLGSLTINGTAISSGSTYTVNSDITISATFTAIPVVTKYSFQTQNTTGGTVTASKANGSYDSGTSISLTATPSDGYNFTKWWDNSVTNPRTLSLTSNTVASATFTAAAQTYTLTLSSAE